MKGRFVWRGRVLLETPPNGGEEFTSSEIFCLHSIHFSAANPKLHLVFVSFIRSHYSSLFGFLQVEGLSQLR